MDINIEGVIYRPFFFKFFRIVNPSRDLARYIDWIDANKVKIYDFRYCEQPVDFIMGHESWNTAHTRYLLVITAARIFCEGVGTLCFRRINIPDLMNIVHDFNLRVRSDLTRMNCQSEF